MRAAIAALAVVLSACTGTAEPVRVMPKPEGVTFGAALPAGGTAFSNASLAALFVRLMHETEWGARRKRLLRFEGPVRVGLTGPGATQHAAFLGEVTAYLAKGAGVDIAPGPVETAEIAVSFVPGRKFRRRLPAASCVLAPGRVGWEDYARNPDALGGDAILTAARWTAVTIFIPDTARPHRVRSCLLEEIPQALGPLNDLDALGPSIFNDDFAHLWPTRLDLLMLRVLHAPEIVPGSAPRQTLAAARQALERLNPEGRTARPLIVPASRQVKAWKELTLRLLATGSARAARRALAHAERYLPGTAFHCQSIFLHGQVLRRQTPKGAIPVLGAARTLCTRIHGPGDIRIAIIRLETAAALERMGDRDGVIAETEGLEAIFAAHGQEERLAAALQLRSRAMASLHGRAASANATDAAKAWSDYSMGGARKP